MATVLVVDDDPSIRAIVETAIAATGHEPISVASGPEALALLERTIDDGPSIDVVVLDVMMPEMDGLEVLSRIRAHEWLFDLPVVMLTALDTPDDEAAGWFHGCDAYVTKPFDPRALLATVGTVLEAGPELRGMRRQQRLAELLDLGARPRQTE